MEAAISSAPKPPDPYATSAAQTQSNQQTASYNAALNRVDTYTPYGNSIYTVTGKDPTGAPTYRQDINLTPMAQQQLDTEQAQNAKLAGLGETLYNQAKGNFNTPLDNGATNGQAAQNAYYSKQTAFLDPQFQHGQDDLDTRLANQGIMQGTTAYNRAQDDFGRQKEFAYGQARDQAILNGQDQQAKSLAIAQQLRQMPLNELNALRTGTQINNPSFQPTAQANANPTDVSGNIWNAYNIASANANNFNSGLFSLGGAVASAFAPKPSDRRLKTNIERIGTTDGLGLPLYVFSYIGSTFRNVGVMAQDVLKVLPSAVFVRPDGYMVVDYAALS